jgi:predicted murein hydrolase (TIGR00659 family)
MGHLAFVAFTVVLTVAVYAVSRHAFLRSGWALLSPVFASTVTIVAVLCSAGLSFEQYRPGQRLMTVLLGPAVVALALPLYRQRRILARQWPAVATAIACGSIVSLVSVIALARAAGLGRHVLLSLAPKSVTAPVAVEIARLVGGDPSLTAAFAIATGTLGSVLGPWVLSCFKIDDPVARGLAVGATAHGQGTAAMLQEGETAGALAGVALVLAAVFTSVVAPAVVPWLVGAE